MRYSVETFQLEIANLISSGTLLNTTWLDTIAKLLHSHPLTVDGRSNLYSSSLIDLDPVHTSRMDSVQSELDTPSPMLFGETDFPQTTNLGALMQGTPTVVGWRKQQLSSSSINSLLPGDQIRERIQLYRKLMSPKQWKQFLSQTLPGQGSMQFNLALLEASVIGVRRAVAECRYQFRNERWNCSQVPNTDTVLFGNLLLKGIPQTAFVYSIINAGIVQSVAEACLGRIDNCPCNNQGRETSTSNWQWQGCDHNIHYSRKFSRRLLDTMEQGSHIRFRMNLHNNKVGRQLVMKNMERYCRCHGTSGSCTLRTCYRRTPRMRVLGNLLKQIYETDSIRIHPALTDFSFGRLTDPRKMRRRNLAQQHESKQSSVRNFQGNGAPNTDEQGKLSSALRYASKTGWSPTDFDFVNDQLALNVQFDRRLGSYASLPTTNRTNRIRRTQLVYYETVPQSLFCEANPRLHIPGTHHRVCNSTSSGPENCAQLCCGRGFLTNHYYAMESCNCKFIWCCRVQCQQCLVLKKIETCL
ncbi:Protein Wnt [Fasciolopsis buskii]|uniref:Protein Wnt n=1 Tax=Fasciolopsis buskii TaxID=27845 RepID=A0A8E0VIV9_9TREM|nr:Protein Wnt [Fasciolopsis buski]